MLLANMMLDEVIVGGVGSGLFGMLLFAIVAVFVAGLMIGRIPEFVGKKITATEVKMTMIAFAVHTARHSRPYGGSQHNRARSGGSRKCRSTRLLRNSLRIHVGGGDQWKRFRRPQREYAVL